MIWPQFAEQADKEGWPAARFLAVLARQPAPWRRRPRASQRVLPSAIDKPPVRDQGPHLLRLQVIRIVIAG